MPKFSLPTHKYILSFRHHGKPHQATGLGNGEIPPHEMLADYLHASGKLKSIVVAEGETSEQSIGDVLAKYGYTDIQVQWLD